MVFLLNDQNVFQYLMNQKVIKQGKHTVGQVESKICKNFNLLVHYSNEYSLLVKQEPHDQEGNTNKDFLYEWRVYQLLQNYSELSQIQSLFPEVLHFDSKHSISILHYLNHYDDLDDFYTQSRIFPSSIAASLGAAIAKVHRTTCDRQDYKAFLTKTFSLEEVDIEIAETVPDLSHELENITPESFGAISADGLKFYELYQRYESLGQAIRELNAAYEPICLIHNDLKLSNILLHHDWKTLFSLLDRDGSNRCFSKEVEKEYPIRFIDWEKWLWGDPAFDLGTLVANYLKIWLKSLVVRVGIDLDTALHLAPISLESIQPSIAALVRSYLANFPEILEWFPDFLQRIIQFTGFALIESIQTKLHYHEPFGNIEICMLQVAKTLLCTPLESIPTVFGMNASDLLNLKNPLLLQAEQWENLIPLEPETKPTTVAQAEPIDRSPIEFTQETMLHDLVSNIQIEANFCIHHPHYPPSKPPAELGDRLSYLPIALQRQYFKAQIQNYIYDIYFSGEELTQTRGRERSLPNSPALENNTVRGLNVQFYEQLHRSNYGDGYFDPDWRVLRQVDDDTLAVQKDALTIRVDPKRHLRTGEQSSIIGDTVAVHLPSNRIESGFYVAVGNAGLVPDTSPAIELYFNITPAGAIDLMRCLTQQFNAIAIPFVFKVISDPAEYGRYDAGILQVECSQYDTIQPVLQQAYRSVSNSFRDMVPLFTKPLAPGLGLAEEPESDSEEFGMSRCKLVADALLSVWQTRTNSPQARIDAIRQRFHEQGLDWQKPYLNPSSQDIYIPFTIDPAI